MMNYDESSNSSFTQFPSSSAAHHLINPTNPANNLPISHQQDHNFPATSSLQMHQIAGSSSSNNSSLSISNNLSSSSSSSCGNAVNNSSLFPTTQSQCQDMAKNFVDWFYKILNTCSHIPDTTELNHTMFWPDANAKVNLLGIYLLCFFYNYFCVFLLFILLNSRTLVVLHSKLHDPE